MRQDQSDVEIIDALYDRYVPAGFTHPCSLADLQTVIVTSGINIEICGDCPAGIIGFQIKSTIYVNGRMPERNIIGAMAHEWFHALRWLDDPTPIRRNYSPTGDPAANHEERLARLFESKFQG